MITWIAWEYHAQCHVIHNANRGAVLSSNCRGSPDVSMMKNWTWAQIETLNMLIRGLWNGELWCQKKGTSLILPVPYDGALGGFWILCAIQQIVYDIQLERAIVKYQAIDTSSAENCQSGVLHRTLRKRTWFWFHLKHRWSSMIQCMWSNSTSQFSCWRNA